MYVLVLGLDVLGNPFGLIRGLTEGVEALFYEPFQVLACCLSTCVQKQVSCCPVTSVGILAMYVSGIMFR